MNTGNPLGAGTVNVSANLPKDLADRLKTLAKESGMSVSSYVRTLCEAADRNGLLLRVPLEINHAGLRVREPRASYKTPPAKSNDDGDRS